MIERAPAQTYLPHQPPLLLLEYVRAITENSATCEVTVSPTGILAPFLDENQGLPAWFGLELMAQTVGVWCGLNDIKQIGAPQIGMLLGCRGFKSTLPAFPLHSALTIHVVKVLQDERLANFDCRISLDDTKIAQSKVTVYQPDAAERARLRTS